MAMQLSVRIQTSKQSKGQAGHDFEGRPTYADADKKHLNRTVFGGTESEIKELIDINLTAPIILSNLCLRTLKKTKGHVINISSIEATRHSKFSALYTASKSGLRDFSLALFEELRKADVKVTNINPDLTKTNFFNEFNFEPGDSKNAHLLASDIAKTVLKIINFDAVVTDITVRAQRLEIKKK